MAEPFKDMFDDEAVRALASLVAGAGPFDEAAFVAAATEGLSELELKGRVLHIAAALRGALPGDYERALGQLVAALPPAADATGSAGGMRLWPLLTFVEVYGVDHPGPSLAALKELTRRFSAEFAIRPYLERWPEETFAALDAWASDPDPHVRRLVSEGTRPRLPWGRRLRAIQADPRRTLGLLERLKDDPDPVVRRSVANHLGDVAKDHPALAVEVATRWLEGASPERRQLVSHGLRDRIKKGDVGALAALGVRRAEVSVLGLELSPPHARLGGGIRIHAQIRSTAAAPQRLVVDYAVHHVRADGSTSPKVFKGLTRDVAPGELLTFTKAHALRPITTRRYYPGVHKVELKINGASCGEATFTLEV